MLRGLYTDKILAPDFTTHTITAHLSRSSLNGERSASTIKRTYFEVGGGGGIYSGKVIFETSQCA